MSRQDVTELLCLFLIENYRGETGYPDTGDGRSSLDDLSLEPIIVEVAQMLREVSRSISDCQNGGINEFSDRLFEWAWRFTQSISLRFQKNPVRSIPCRTSP